MPLGTLDRTPPPFFRQGYSALSKVVFFSALSLFCMVADRRLQVVAPVRVAVASALAPLQQALLMPQEAVGMAGDYLQGLRGAIAARDTAKRESVALAERAATAQRLEQENVNLRALLELGPTLATRSVAAEVLYEAADPFSRKVVVNRGTTQGVVLGAPVLSTQGIIGQVTRVYPMSSEVTLVTDRDAAIPVLNTRTQQRGAAFGGLDRGTAMELRFVLSSADLQVGDELRTSGLDGVYPSGLPVAKVRELERQGDGGFARVLLSPVAQLDGVRHVLVLEPTGMQLPPRPIAEAAVVKKGASPAQTASAASAPAAMPANGKSAP